MQVSEFALKRIIEEMGKRKEVFARNCVKPTDNLVGARTMHFTVCASSREILRQESC